MKILVLTGNPSKAEQYKSFADTLNNDHRKLEIFTRKQNVPELGDSFRSIAANKLILACNDIEGVEDYDLIVADDAGITFPDIGCVPGVLSKRWRGSTSIQEVHDQVVLEFKRNNPIKPEHYFVDCYLHCSVAGLVPGDSNKTRTFHSCTKVRYDLQYQPRGWDFSSNFATDLGEHDHPRLKSFVKLLFGSKQRGF